MKTTERWGLRCFFRGAGFRWRFFFRLLRQMCNYSYWKRRIMKLGIHRLIFLCDVYSVNKKKKKCVSRVALFEVPTGVRFSSVIY
jgi:hypothetical protein